MNKTKLGAFRHQLWLEHIEIVDEIRLNNNITFVIEQPTLEFWEMQNLLRIWPFSVLVLAHDGNFKLHLMLLDND